MGKRSDIQPSYGRNSRAYTHTHTRAPRHLHTPAPSTTHTDEHGRTQAQFHGLNGAAACSTPEWRSRNVVPRLSSTREHRRFERAATFSPSRRARVPAKRCQGAKIAREGPAARSPEVLSPHGPFSATREERGIAWKRLDMVPQPRQLRRPRATPRS